MVDYFHSRLFYNEKACLYLKGRGFTLDMLKYWKLGYCPNRVKGFELLNNRIVFPIWNWQGEVVSFAGRTLKDGVKYLTLQEGGFKKSNNLYGINYALPHIVKSRICYVVEGFTDVLGLYGGGIPMAVATMGIAVTYRQLLLLARWARAIIFVFDGDKAGKSGIEKALKLAKELEVRAGYILLPEKKDPFDMFASSTDMVPYFKNSVIFK